MREIDSGSPWPEDDIDFCILWCRVVSLNCKEWKFQLRDFPQPLLHIRKCYIGGTLVGAEQVAPKRGKKKADSFIYLFICIIVATKYLKVLNVVFVQ